MYYYFQKIEVPISYINSINMANRVDVATHVICNLELRFRILSTDCLLAIGSLDANNGLSTSLFL